MRTGEHHLLDRVFESQINRAIAETDENFNRKRTRKLPCVEM